MQPARKHRVLTFSGALSFVLEVLADVTGGKTVELTAAWLDGGGNGLMISFGVGLIVWIVGLVVPVLVGDLNDGDDEIGLSGVALSFSIFKIKLFGSF